MAQRIRTFFTEKPLAQRSAVYMYNFHNLFIASGLYIYIEKYLNVIFIVAQGG